MIHPILSELNPAHTITKRVMSILISSSHLGLTLTQLAMWISCPAYLVHIDFVTLVIASITNYELLHCVIFSTHLSSVPEA
jgi:hypothetical protein